MAVGDVSGKGAPAALYGAFASELVRSRTMRRRFTPDRFSVAGVLQAMNTTLHERQLEEYYCTLCYAFFDFSRRMVTLRFRPSVPDSLHVDLVRTDRTPGGVWIVSRCDLRTVTIPLKQGDVFVFCTDGIFEALNEDGVEFRRDSPGGRRQSHARGVGSLDRRCNFEETLSFRGSRPQGDDMTAVAVKITE